MRVLVLGADGQVGHELVGVLGRFAAVVAARRGDADLEDPDSLRSVLAAAAPDAIVNAAAFNDVEAAERDPSAARRVNTDAVAVLGEEATRRRIALVHYSTDFVFDGTKGAPYVEADVPAPLNAYGRSKLDGERALLDMNAPAVVLRTAWVYGARRRNFVTTLLRLARERDQVRVVSDQIGSPTFCRDLALATASVLRSADAGAPPCDRADSGRVARGLDAARGVYHAAGGGACSRYELALAALALDPRKHEQRALRIEPIPTVELALRAVRPEATPLDCARLAERFGVRLPDWRDGLRRALGGRATDPNGQPRSGGLGFRGRE